VSVPARSSLVGERLEGLMAKTGKRLTSIGAGARVLTVAERRLEVLAQEGYRPTLDDAAGDEPLRAVAFKVRGEKFFVWCDESDPNYFWLACSFQLGPGPRDPASVGALVNEMNELMKGVKVAYSLQEWGVVFSVEQFVDGDPTPAVLERSIEAIQAASTEFFEKLRPPAQLDA
jgi:hypothetical protein